MSKRAPALLLHWHEGTATQRRPVYLPSLTIHLCIMLVSCL